MSIIKLHHHYFKKFITKEEIDLTIKSVAAQIFTDLKGETPLFIAILNGSFMYAADLLRHYPGPCEISFVKLASYQGTNSSGTIKNLIGLNSEVEGRTVVVLEDIVDTGNTLQEIYNLFENKKLKALKIATLFLKPDVYIKELPIDYIGLSIPDKFIVGYGLDYDDLGRNLSDVYQLTKLKMKNIVLFGPPGAGKGTQADLLKTIFGLVHISTGDVFRQNIQDKTALGLLAKSFMNEGNLVPDEVTIDMLKAEVEKNPNANGFIFDGFPRTEAQAKALDLFLNEKGETINAMVALEVPETVLVNRLLERGKISGRPDDQDEVKIRTRFHEYATKTAVLKDYYFAQGKYFGVNGVGSIEDITNRLEEVVKQL